MTDHVITLTVVLDKDYREDDAEMIIDAIKMIRGVRAVEIGKIADPDTYFAIDQARSDLIAKLRGVLFSG